MNVVVCGSRDFANPFVMALAIDARIAALPAGTTVIHGDARGADRIAAEAAARHGHTVRAMLADWDRHGRRAGIVRNLAMLDLRPDLVVAFWDGSSRGTAHTISVARQRGLPLEVIQE